MKTLTLTAMFLTAALTAPVAATEQVPFRGSLDAVEIHTGAFPIISVTLNGTGTATHLGRFTTMFEFQIDLRTADGFGTFVFVAATGDTVFGTETGHATVTGTLAAIVETATITGGTGRFAGATGSFTIERVVDQPTGFSSGSFDGTIALDH